VGWAERRYDGGFGIMIDDVVAALYAIIVIVIGRMLLER
jgi:phosphatidylglycerophosphatase A